MKGTLNSNNNNNNNNGGNNVIGGAYNQYQIKKMYNQEEVKLLEAPETKLWEMQIRLKDSEKEKHDLKRE